MGIGVLRRHQKALLEADKAARAEAHVEAKPANTDEATTEDLTRRPKNKKSE